MPRLTVVLVAVGVFALLALGGGVYLRANVGCAALTADTDVRVGPTPHPGDVFDLNETRVRAEAPDVAGLLDAAVEDGQATLDSPKRAPAAYQYLSREMPGGAQGATVRWQGTMLQLRYVVC